MSSVIVHTTLAAALSFTKPLSLGDNEPLQWVSALPNINKQHAYFDYSGRISFNGESLPRLSWAGSQVHAQFTGRHIEVVLDDDTGLNAFNAFINDQYQQPIIIQTRKGPHRYLIANDLGSGTHTLRLTKRTEGHEGGTQFHGIIIAQDGEIRTPRQKPTRKIEFYGDSITSGLGNEAPLNAEDNDPTHKNNFLSYAAITARHFNAEHRSISASGIGLMASWFDWTMLDYYNRTDATAPDGPRWDFNQWQADIVVVNLGQNDSWLLTQESVPDTHRVAAFQQFFTTLRNHYPNAHIIATLGCMNAVAPGSPWPGYVKQAVKNIRNQGDDRIHYHFFAYADYDKHPRVSHHQIMANALISFIDTTIDW